MIKESFIFLDRVGLNKEKSIWGQGIRTWDDFCSAGSIKGISNARKCFYERQLNSARKELYGHNSSHFKAILPASETWRLYNFFKEDAVFLDIETAHYYGYITVIGLYSYGSNETKTMIKDINLDKGVLKRELSRYKLIITFNGSSFDLPVIERYFQGVVPDVPHIDLRHVCSRVGLKGGLKSIEKQMGITRLPELKDVTGEDAAELWRVFKATGDRYYLDLLVKYNEEDIINLKPIADFAVKELWNKIRNSIINNNK